MKAPEFLPHGNPTFGQQTWETARLSLLIVRLSPFADVDKSTPHLFLASCAASVDGVFADFAFLPPYYERMSRLKRGEPLLIGVASNRSIRDFDLVLVSNSYTLELVNLPYLLIHSGIPLRASQRGTEWPLIILGGSNACATGSVFFYPSEDSEAGRSALPEDSFVDGVFFGEGEELVPKLIALTRDVWGRDKRNAGCSKAAALSTLAEHIPALFVPACPTIPEKAVVHDPNAFAGFSSYPLLNSEEAATAKLPISAGCPSFCSFCFEGWDRKPYREVPLQTLLSGALLLKKNSGASTLDLASFNFNTHSDIFSLLLRLNKIFMHVNMMSQRVDILDSTPGLLKAELLASKRSFTLGVEGISGRMRTFLHKGLTEETVCAVVKRLFTEGVREIKFFFILTGHEEEADRDEFGRFVKCVKKLRRDSGSQTRVIFSFGYLIRMPFTPLQFDECMLEYDSYHVIASSCKRDCETNGFEFRLAMNFDEYCFSQVLALIGRGGAPLLTACAERDVVYDSYLSKGGWEFARAFLTESGFLSDEFIGQKDASYVFPLEWIKGVPEKRYLYRQYESCRAFSEGSSCFEADSAAFEEGCLGCGACRDANEKRAILSHTIHLPQSTAYWTELSEVIKEKQKIAPIFYEIRLPVETAGACPEWKSAFIMRKLFEAMPSEVSNLLYADDVLSQGFQRRFGAYHGYTVIGLYAFDQGRLSSSLLACRESPLSIRPLDRDDASPDRIEGIVLSLRLPEEGYARAETAFCEYLKGSHLSYLRRRDGFGYVYEVVPKDRKKKSIFHAHSSKGEGGVYFRIEGGKNLDLSAFLHEEVCAEVSIEVLVLQF